MCHSALSFCSFLILLYHSYKYKSTILIIARACCRIFATIYSFAIKNPAKMTGNFRYLLLLLCLLLFSPLPPPFGGGGPQPPSCFFAHLSVSGGGSKKPRQDGGEFSLFIVIVMSALVFAGDNNFTVIIITNGVCRNTLNSLNLRVNNHSFIWVHWL